MTVCLIGGPNSVRCTDSSNRIRLLRVTYIRRVAFAQARWSLRPSFKPGSNPIHDPRHLRYVHTEGPDGIVGTSRSETDATILLASQFEEQAIQSEALASNKLSSGKEGARSLRRQGSPKEIDFNGPVGYLSRCRSRTPCSSPCPICFSALRDGTRQRRCRR